MVTRANDNEICCTQINKHGGCQNLPMEGCTKCEHHGGNNEIASQKKQELRNYRLNKFKARQRVAELSNSTELKMMHDEVGILRAILEEILEACGDDYDMLLASNQIASLVSTIDKTVKSCHQLELTSGELLSRNDLAAFAMSIVGIVTEECNDEQAAIISERILQLTNR